MKWLNTCAFILFLTPVMVLAQTRPAVQVNVMKKATSNDGTSIAYEQTGSGPTLILVGGALSSRSSGTRLAGLLAPHFTVINYDRRGRGNSTDTQPYAVQREVEDIEALIDASGGSAFIFGSSSGAVLALEATSKLAGKIKKAVLFEPPFIIDDSRAPVPDFVPQVKHLIAVGKRGDAVEFFMGKAVGVPPEMLAQMKQSPMWPSMEKLAHTLLYDGAIMGETLSGKPLPADRWSSAKAPILVMDGGNSEPWLRHAAEALPKVLPSAQHRTLEGQDHSAPFTAPQIFCTDFRRVFRRLVRPGLHRLPGDFS